MLLARPGPVAIGVALAGVALAVWMAPLPLARVLRPVRQLRWFLAVIVVFYAFLTPGTPVMPGAPGIMPTREGLLAGGERLFALVVLVVAVQVMLATTSRAALVAALHWWLRPLERIGAPVDRFALRLVLVLEAAPALRERIRGLGGPLAGEPWRHRLGGFGARALAEVLDAADAAPRRPVRVPQLPAVPVGGWLAPLAMVSLVLALDAALAPGALS